MRVSALLTSLGINSGLCVLFFTLYSVLRKQPSYLRVYIPRFLAEGGSRRLLRLKLRRFVPSAGWVARAWRLSEEDIISSNGLDALVFMRVITFCLKIFAFAGVIGIFVLLPVNALGTQLHEIDFADISNNSMDVFTISNVNDGSERLWIHFGAVYIMTIFICCLLFHEYKYISLKRIAFFYSSDPQPHQFTILVSNIPVSSGSNISESVQRFFRENHPNTYLSHVVIRRTSKIRDLTVSKNTLHLISDLFYCLCYNEAKKLCKRVIRLRGSSSYDKLQHFPLFSEKVDLVDHYEKRLETIDRNVKFEQSDISMAKDTRAAFVSFRTRYAAATALHLQQSINPIHWITEEAPETDDVYWPFFSSTFMQRWTSKLLIVAVCILLTVLFLIPVVVVQGLTNLNQLEAWFPALKGIITSKFISQIITGYLPSLILQLFLKFVPPIMRFLSSIQGYISLSQIEKSACDKGIWFTVWNVFFATVFSGSVFYQLSIVLDPKSIPRKLGVAVPAQASFFIAYVVTTGWTSISSELFRVIPFLGVLIAKLFGRNAEDEDFDVPSIAFHKDLPRILFFGLLGIAYFFLAPLILPFLLVYFCMVYIIFRNQFINVYAPKYETGGRFWPMVHNTIIFSLVLMHAIAGGIFTLKKLSWASTLVSPLPVFTLLFNEYCRKRFLPLFTAYPAEVLVQKDRADFNSGVMSEFYSRLVTAYEDPAMAPVHYSSNTDSLSQPLLSPES
ncbi:CSC1-like protein At1g69450 [Linum perenne]